MVYGEFYSLVNHNKPWDIKEPKVWPKTIGTDFPGKGVYVSFCGISMTPEDLGNYTYGFLGYAYGIPIEHLIVGSYYAADFPLQGEALSNEVKDWYYVCLGYKSAEVGINR